MADREPYPSEKQDRFIVRLPDGMRDRIRDAAAANNRSMNAEIVARLSATLEDPAFETLPDTVADMLNRIERLERMVRDLDEAANPLRYDIG